MPRHINNDGGVCRQAVRPVCGIAGLLAAASDENQRGGDFAMGEGNPISRRRAQGCCNTGDNLDFYAGMSQSLELFSATPEDEWVATFEAHDGPSHECVLDEQLVGFTLRGTLLAAALANVHDFGCGRNQIENFCADQLVMEDNICRAKHFGSFQGE
jgi:hypothetical protein